MAEAHAAVAFSFSVSSEGFSVNINKQALGALQKSGTRALKKRIARFKNSIYNQVYPFHPSSWFYFASGVFATTYLSYDYKKSPISYIEEFLIRYVGLARYHHVPACLIFSLMLWFGGSVVNQMCLRVLLSYTGWMYLPRGVKSYKIALWGKIVQLFKSRHQRLYGYQYSLPALPLPRLKDTINKCLLSVKHLKTPEEYDALVRDADSFLRGPGPKLQIFLWLKTWITSNYVSDWWEEYVYLAGRDPIMSNSNFYGLEWMRTREIRPTQAASAAMITFLLCQVRRKLIREEIPPIQIYNMIPLCSWQYERVFNTTRIPCVDKDKIVHLADSTHIVVYHRGCYYRCPLVVDGQQLTAADMEYQFNCILNAHDATPCAGEENLAALTAGPRDSWAIARSTYFATGKNRASLDLIEKAAFFLALDDEPAHPMEPDSSDYLSHLGKMSLTGNCHNRWFDKSFMAIVHSDGTRGFNAEHSWADAPTISHVFELVTVAEWQGIEKQIPGMHFTKDGHCDGTLELKVTPRRLVWDLSPACIAVIDSSLATARNLADAIDLVVTRFCDYGRCFIKRAGYSPDAYVQMALQLAYYMDQQSVALVYESSMTRLFREGRTETVRSCTAESTEFVRSMLDDQRTAEERAALFKIATDQHQLLTRDAISGKGVDRHLFALYITSKFLRMDNSFLKKVLSEPWRLSTSQTPTNQTLQMTLPSTHPDSNRIGGGGFGPVDKDGYGVSYMFSMENALCFHVSSRYDCPKTSSKRFTENILQALHLIRDTLVSLSKKPLPDRLLND
ncbi:Carnitine palmitoyltransferase I [Fasciola gigantica]|uniref:carnitine O-palmitoyltransferase n=1 Tax=Fasciola gigantica TaxID=46835 RepID=A0A504Y8K5_FASGI|nr:Carnitine palmitoyltransferase I [Fasciola gigantica]